MSERNLGALGWALLSALVGCHSQPVDPPPPPASYELTPAAPGAQGARAAGTKGAPPAPSEGELAVPGSDDAVEPEPDEDDAGTEPDAGTAADAAPGVAL